MATHPVTDSASLIIPCSHRHTHAYIHTHVKKKKNTSSCLCRQRSSLLLLFIYFRAFFEVVRQQCRNYQCSVSYTNCKGHVQGGRGEIYGERLPEDASPFYSTCSFFFFFSFLSAKTGAQMKAKGEREKKKKGELYDWFTLQICYHTSIVGSNKHKRDKQIRKHKKPENKQTKK